MNIFISWSGTRSKKAAKALKNWLPTVIHVAEPWMSDDDIPAGRDALMEIDAALGQSLFGVVCITADNMDSSFMNYETRALRQKGIDVCPYIIDLSIKRRDLRPPFELQAKMANEEDIEQFVLDINKALGSPVTNIATLKRTVKSNWNKLEKELERIRNEKPPKDPEYEKMIEDFCETFMDVNRYRASLNFSSSVDKAIELFADKQYNRQKIIEHALEIIVEKRELYDRRSILVGNVGDFLKEHFTEDDIEKIVGRLEPIIISKSARRIKHDRLSRHIKTEELEVFLRFHQILVRKLREKLS